MWESPIDIIYSETQTKLEGKVFKAVQNVGINVNKDELIKALSYDRHQYEKGYADAKAEQQWIPVTERLPNEDEIIYNGVGINGERKVSDRVCAIDSDGFIRCGYFQKSCMEHEYWGNGRKNEYSETGFASWEFGDHWDCDPNQWIVTVSTSIVAWMPLPEPYKEEDNERA